MIQSENKKLSKATNKYNNIVDRILNNKNLQDATLVQKVIDKMDALVEKAENKLKDIDC